MESNTSVAFLLLIMNTYETLFIYRWQINLHRTFELNILNSTFQHIRVNRLLFYVFLSSNCLFMLGSLFHTIQLKPASEPFFSIRVSDCERVCIT